MYLYRWEVETKDFFIIINALFKLQTKNFNFQINDTFLLCRTAHVIFNPSKLPSQYYTISSRIIVQKYCVTKRCLDPIKILVSIIMRFKYSTSHTEHHSKYLETLCQFYI